jgi:hypothetical protein
MFLTANMSFMQCKITDVFCFIWCEKAAMICVVLLQNCRCFAEGEPGSCRETYVKCDVDGSEEVSVKIEETIDIKAEIAEFEIEEAIDIKDEIAEFKIEDAIDIKGEIAEAIIFPSIKTEHEVRQS